MSKFEGFKCDAKTGNDKEPCQEVMEKDETITEVTRYTGPISGSKTRHLCLACAPEESTLDQPKPRKKSGDATADGVQEPPQGI